MGILTGRDTIGLKDSLGNEVEINVVKSIKYDYPVSITKHATESGAKIADHVNTDQGTISLDCVISSTFELFPPKKISQSYKINLLVNWRAYGSVLTVLGYGTRSLFSLAFPSDESVFKSAEDSTDQFLGLGQEEIDYLLISGLNYDRTIEAGKDIPCNIKLTRVAVAKSKTATISGETEVKSGSIKKTSKKDPAPPESILSKSRN